MVADTGGLISDVLTSADSHEFPVAQFSLENKLFGGIYVQFRLVVGLQYSVSPNVGLKPLDILNEARKQGVWPSAHQRKPRKWVQECCQLPPSKSGRLKLGLGRPFGTLA